MTEKRHYTNHKGREVLKVTCDYSESIPEEARNQIAKHFEEDETLGKTGTAYCWIIGIIIGSIITYILYSL